MEDSGVEVAAPGLRRQSMRAAPLRSASSSGVLDRLFGETHAVAYHREPIIILRSTACCKRPECSENREYEPDEQDRRLDEDSAGE